MITAFINLKGGSTKSSSAVHLCRYLLGKDLSVRLLLMLWVKDLLFSISKLAPPEKSQVSIVNYSIGFLIMVRKKLTDAQKQFITGDDTHQQASASVSTSASTEISAAIGANLKQELFGDRQSKESSIRFTVDVPHSLNKRLSQLSVDTGKPKTELVRTILNQALSSLDY